MTIYITCEDAPRKRSDRIKPPKNRNCGHQASLNVQKKRKSPVSPTPNKIRHKPIPTPNKIRHKTINKKIAEEHTKNLILFKSICVRAFLSLV